MQSMLPMMIMNGADMSEILPLMLQMQEAQQGGGGFSGYPGM
jgi:hypothetical protein